MARNLGLTDDEVNRMVVDSLVHAEADLAARALIDARNEAQTVVAATEKALRSAELAEIATTALVRGERLHVPAHELA